jgi:hypothetical protein
MNNEPVNLVELDSRIHPKVLAERSLGNACFYGDREMAKYHFYKGYVEQEYLFDTGGFKDSGRRFLTYEWTWGVGHIGILGQLIKLKLMNLFNYEIVVETGNRIANQYFLESMGEHITVYNELPPELRNESVYNMLFFSCPFGSHVHEWCKKVERMWEKFPDKKPVCKFTPEMEQLKDSMISAFGLKRPYAAIHARNTPYDPKRNMSLETMLQATKKLTDQGYDLISIGLDDHPINQHIKNIQFVGNPKATSFVLSADCDYFMGSDSGMGMVANMFQRPVDLINDYEHVAWIYP